MAQKKKVAAKRHKQQQKKQQRRSARVNKRQAAAHPAQLNAMPEPSDSVLNDLYGLFPAKSMGELSEEDFTQTILPVAWDSADLADEPEFADIELSPLETTQVYIEALQEQGVDSEDVDELSDEERREAIGEALDEAVQRLLTPALRQQLIAGLTKLRARWKRENRPNEAPRVAAVQLFLEIDQEAQVAATLGLVQELVRRSIHTGFEVAQILKNLPERDESGLPPTELSTSNQ